MKKLILLTWVVFTSLMLHAQKGLLPVHLDSMKTIVEAAVSDDGRYVAYVKLVPRLLSEGAGYAYRELYVFDVAGKQSTGLLTGKVSVSSLSWMPGENSICFRTSMNNSHGRQVFALTVDRDDEPRQLTSLNKPVINYQFINKNTLAITVLEDEEKQLLARKSAGFEMKIYEEQLRHIELHRYDISSGKSVPLTRGVSVFDFSVSPDGSKIAAAIAPQNLVDDSYMFKRIHILNAQNGDVLERIENPGKLGKMAWSPDSKKLAFIAASKREDSVDGSLFIFETGNGVQYLEIRNYVKGMELSVKDVIWTDSETVLYLAEQCVDMVVRKQRITDKGSSEVMPGGLANFRSFQKSEDFLYFTGHTPAYPSDLLRYNLKSGEVERLTNSNNWLDNVTLSRQEMIQYKARDGEEIHGVLVYPLNYIKDLSYPLIVYIHGGPESCVQNGWVSNYSQWGQFAAARDYFVFYPNYRASSGRGVDFTMEGYGALLEKEYEDVIDGIDYLIENKFVDPSKVGIGGGSYGGYFAAWSSTKYTDRFAASVVFVGVTNQVSKRNLTDIPWEDYYVHWGFWTHENHEKVWEASPVKYAYMSKTPTLILHGEEDPRIPVSQGMELYRALKLHGKAPVRLVLYPGEGHGNAINTNRFDFLVRTLEWFDYYLQGKQPLDKMPGIYPLYD